MVGIGMRSPRVLAIACLPLLVSCIGGTEPPPERLESLPRALTNQEVAVINSSNAFTLELFRKASSAEPKQNVFLSPLSASMSLGMTLNGARGTTFDAMRTALQFGTLPQADINASYKSLIALLLGLDPTVETRIANSIWYRNTLPIAPAFVTASRDYFDAAVAPLDFTKPDQAMQTVNGWVNTKTAGRIPSILEKIESTDVMYLINAIYFKASWRSGFKRSETQSNPFKAGSGVTQSVPMMHLDAKGFRGGQWPDGTKAVELPYGNAAFNMSVFLPPDSSSIETFIARLKVEDIASAGNGDIAELQLWMPRVTLEYKRKLNDDLKGLGMGIAFTDAADLSGMTTTATPLLITDVTQKTFLSIDEEGTEAAAVTKTGIGYTSAPMSFSMRCDRPYLVVIRERLSGTIVFIGKINTI